MNFEINTDFYPGFCWLIFSFCVGTLLFANLATFAPQGYWLQYTMAIGSIVGGSISLYLALWLRRRVK